jgi:hypothetical protein
LPIIGADFAKGDPEAIRAELIGIEDKDGVFDGEALYEAGVPSRFALEELLRRRVISRAVGGLLNGSSGERHLDGDGQIVIYRWRTL